MYNITKVEKDTMEIQRQKKSNKDYIKIETTLKENDKNEKNTIIEDYRDISKANISI